MRNCLLLRLKTQIINKKDEKIKLWLFFVFFFCPGTILHVQVNIFYQLKCSVAYFNKWKMICTFIALFDLGTKSALTLLLIYQFAHTLAHR